MGKHTVITISRQYGSGGRLIGQMLAQQLGVPFYDNELITMAAKASGLGEDLFKNADQSGAGSLLYSMSVYGSVNGFFDLPLSDKVFLAQSEVIRKVAAEGPCVIVGRCADYVLKGKVDAVNVFIHSDMEHRKKRVVEEYGKPAERVEELITKTDKRRATYYSYYSGMKFGRAENYHLTVNSDCVGIEATVELIKNFYLAKAARQEAAV